MASILTTAFIYLFAAAVAVPICKRLGLGTVLGYLLAGVVIGPVLGLVGKETEDIQQVAEFGVVVMLFLVGLELEPAKLWKLRHKLLGLGGLQVLGTVALVAAAAAAFGLPWQTAVAAGCVLASSSTAIVLQTLGEKKLMGSSGGQSSFAVLLFQDIAVIPMLALLPLMAVPELAGQSASAGHESASLVEGMNVYLRAFVTLGAVAAVVAGGVYLSRPIFRYIASTKMRELNTVTALTMVVGIAALMSLVGLSPALGTFIAGVVLANSEYRHDIESILEPFKGLLLGLFFITVGASIDFGLLSAEWPLILGLTAAVMAGKAMILFVLAKLFKLHNPDDKLFALGLSQAGEFGFVLLSFVVANAVMPSETAARLMLVVALSMLVTPLLFIVYDKIIVPRSISNDARQADSIAEENPVLLCGHGRFGQMVAGILRSAGYDTTIIDYDIVTVEGMSGFGIKTYYGDASSPDLLEAAGIAKAKLLVVAVDDKESALRIVEYASHTYPKLPMVVRAYDRVETYKLYRAGATEIVRETFDAAIRAGRLSLEKLGMDKTLAEDVSELYYHRDRHGVAASAEHFDPELPRFANQMIMDIVKNNDLETAVLIRELIESRKTPS